MQPDSRFSIIEFSSEAVVYDRLSGDSHYLSPMAYARLQQRNPAEIASLLDVPLDHRLEQELEALDAQFLAWGIRV